MQNLLFLGPTLRIIGIVCWKVVHEKVKFSLMIDYQRGTCFVNECNVKFQKDLWIEKSLKWNQNATFWCNISNFYYCILIIKNGYFWCVLCYQAKVPQQLCHWHCPVFPPSERHLFLSSSKVDVGEALDHQSPLGGGRCRLKDWLIIGKTSSLHNDATLREIQLTK